MKAKLYSLLVLVFLALSGCTQPVSNLTAPQIPQNPSDIYTLTAHTQLNDTTVVPGSTVAYITIEGEQHEMEPSPSGGDIYQYEYTMPSDRSQAKFFYTIKYNVQENGLTRQKTATSQLYTLSVVNRYVITMEASRGPVGASIPVVGSGFTSYDKVVIGGVDAPTSYASPYSLSFEVPALPAGQDYEVDLHSGDNVFPMGLFHLDVSNLSVTPGSLEVASGDDTTLVVGMGLNAPGGGVPVDVLTDVPASVIMAPVVIPGGARTVSVKIKGGQPGEGSLHLNAPGFNGVIVPISVTPAVVPVAPPPAPVAAPVTPPPSHVVVGS
ncbi:MAG: IPT/TIG domain-containing protein [Opitutales bacterium]|jgi:hypothetical protein